MLNKRRIKKVEDTLNKGKENLVVFQVRDKYQDEDHDRQYQKYITKGGDPNAFFVDIVMFS